MDFLSSTNIPRDVLSILFSFLESEDLLSLRVTSSKGTEVLHEPESEAIWKEALLRDFSIDEQYYPRTLRVSDATSEAASSGNGPVSAFGFSPSESVFEATDAFESWKYWKKASLRYYKTKEGSNDAPPNLNIYGPSALWNKIIQWCESPISGDTGSNMLEIFQPGLAHYDWPENLQDLNTEQGLWACQAVYSFCGGQSVENDLDVLLAGLFGGYSAYHYYSCTKFSSPFRITHSPGADVIVRLGDCLLSARGGITKYFCLHVPSGQVYLSWMRGTIPVVNIPERSNKLDTILLWMEEYANRLESESFRIGPMADDPDSPKAIVLYPQITPNTSNTGGEIPTVSRAVTRGVEVVASSVYTPHCSDSGSGYIYSLRIRLLTSADGEEYVSPSDRGFKTCQLQSRHWQINNSEAGTSEHVDGDGVIGMYPLLREGGFRQYQGPTADTCRFVGDMPGTFAYQSCTLEMQGSFQGLLRFVPGSLESPTGEPFHVVVAPFSLDMHPPFLY